MGTFIIEDIVPDSVGDIQGQITYEGIFHLGIQGHIRDVGCKYN